MHRLADLDGAFVGLLLAGDHAEQRGLAGAVRSDDADDAAGRQFEGEVVDQQVVAEAFAQVFEIDHVLAEPLGHRNDDLRDRVLLGIGDLEQLLVALVARLGFRLPRLRRRRYPLAFAIERAPARLILAAFLLHALLFLMQPGGVVALVGNAAAVVELEDPAGDVVEEVAVVGDDQDGARIVAQVAFQPGHAFGVEMVGRLVEQQQVGLVEQQLAQRHAALLAAGELGDLGVVGRAAQRVHGLGRPWNRGPTGSGCR